jgi:hypothetical protein
MNESEHAPNTNLNRIKHEQLFAEHLLRLDVIVPPATILEPAIRYRGVARYVAFYQVAASKEARYDDGYMDEAAGGDAWSILCDHLVHAIKKCIDVSSQMPVPPAYALILDRQDRQFYLARHMMAVQFVNSQDRSLRVEASWIGDSAPQVPSAQLPLVFVDESVAYVNDLDARRFRCQELRRWLETWIPSSTDPAFRIFVGDVGMEVFCGALRVATVTFVAGGIPIIVVQPEYQHLQTTVEGAVAKFLVSYRYN